MWTLSRSRPSLPACSHIHSYTTAAFGRQQQPPDSEIVATIRFEFQRGSKLLCTSCCFFGGVLPEWAAVQRGACGTGMLCPAYNGLEAHAFEVEEQLRKLQQKTAAAAAADNGISEAAVQARVQAAVEQVRAK